MNEQARTPFFAEVVAALRESFRISEADKQAKFGVFRRVFFNLMQIGGAVFYPLWVASKTPRQLFSDNADLYNQMADVGFWLVAAGWFLCALFCRVEMNDKSGRVRTMHPAGQFGGRVLAAGALLLIAAIAIDAFAA